MRSHELAALVGVSVRTLRHYHHVGVLPEPGRTSNGYRDYTVHHLIRLLRIRRLAVLGLALDEMTTVLDAEPQEHAAVLSQLEADLDAQIAHLQQQKRLLSLIRDEQMPPDLPPELGRLTALLTVPALSPSATRSDREHVLLLTHLMTGRGRRALDELHQHLSEPGIRSLLVRVARDLDRLPGDATADTVDALVHRIATQLAPLLAGLRDVTEPLLPESATAVELLRTHQHDALNPAQRRAIAQIGELMQEAEVDGAGPG